MAVGGVLAQRLLDLLMERVLERLPRPTQRPVLTSMERGGLGRQEMSETESDLTARICCCHSKA